MPVDDRVPGELLLEAPTARQPRGLAFPGGAAASAARRRRQASKEGKETASTAPNWAGVRPELGKRARRSAQTSRVKARERGVRGAVREW